MSRSRKERIRNSCLPVAYEAFIRVKGVGEYYVDSDMLSRLTQREENNVRNTKQ
jgi:hypothetical protein